MCTNSIGFDFHIEMFIIDSPQSAMQCVGILSVDGFEHFKIKQGAISGEDWWQCNCEAEPVFASGKFRRLIVDNASVHRMMGDQVKVSAALFSSPRNLNGLSFPCVLCRFSVHC